MGYVADVLKRTFAAVRPEVRLPVLVVTEHSPSQEVLRAIQAQAGTTIRHVSALGNVVALSVTGSAAQNIAGIPGVLAVQPDVPIFGVGG